MITKFAWSSRTQKPSGRLFGNTEKVLWSETAAHSGWTRNQTVYQVKDDNFPGIKIDFNF